MIDNIRLHFYSGSRTISLNLYSKDILIGSSSCEISDIIIKPSLNSYIIWISCGTVSNFVFITESLFNSLSAINFDSYINPDESTHLDLS